MKNTSDEKSRWCLLAQKSKESHGQFIFLVKYDVIVSDMVVYGKIIIATYWGYT